MWLNFQKIFSRLTIFLHSDSTGLAWGMEEGEGKGEMLRHTSLEHEGKGLIMRGKLSLPLYLSVFVIPHH